jgi:hypothetical protein
LFAAVSARIIGFAHGLLFFYPFPLSRRSRKLAPSTGTPPR